MHCGISFDGFLSQDFESSKVIIKKMEDKNFMYSFQLTGQRNFISQRNGISIRKHSEIGIAILQPYGVNTCSIVPLSEVEY